MTGYVGNDHADYPYSAVTYIEVTYPDGSSYSGSGVVVGQNDVLTASHVIYDINHGGLAEDITVYPGRDGFDSPSGSYDGVDANYFEVDLDGDGLFSRSESEYDIAIIGFDETIGLDTGYFGLDPHADDGFFNVTGYPEFYRDYTGARMTNDYGSAYTGSYDYVWNYGTIETDSGNSGGPLWYEYNGDPYVVGVVSTGGWAVDVSSQYDNILNWMDSNDSLLENNNPPVAMDDVFTVNGDAAINVLENDFDPDGDVIQLGLVSDGSHGTTEITDSQKVRYEPNPGFTGTDTFYYGISDGNGGSDTASAVVTIEQSNQSPVGSDDSAQTRAGKAVIVDVLANDSDPDGDSLSLESVSDPANGQATITAGDQVSYTPDASFTGTESFSYTVADGNGGTAEASVEVTVAPAQDQPGSIGDNEDFEVLQHASPGVVSAGQGDDTYIVSSSTLNGGDEVTVQDGQGANSLQLVEGLEIAASTVAATALQLTLENGAVINVNGADEFTYEPGGNTVAGVNDPDVSFDAFVTDTLGIMGGVPTSGTAEGDPIII